MAINYLDYAPKEMLRELVTFYETETSGDDLRAPSCATPSKNTMYENTPELDSKIAAGSLPILEKHLHVKVAASKVRPGGYYQKDEFVHQMATVAVKQAIQEGKIQLEAET